MARPVTNDSALRQMREAAGLTDAEAAKMFGLAFQTWKNKESTDRFTAAEEIVLQLLAGTHPEYVISRRS